MRKTWLLVVLSLSRCLQILYWWYCSSPPDSSEIMKSCWGYIYLSWLLENIKISKRFGELSPADAFRRSILGARCLRKTSPVWHTARQPTWELSDTKIRTFHTEIITTCHQLVERDIPLPLKFCRVAHMLLVCGGVKFGMVWTPWGFAEICLHHPIWCTQKHKFRILQRGERHPTYN